MRLTYREALLRPEWGRLYPGLRAAVWLPADDVAAYVRGHLDVLEGEGVREDRVLSDVHFEFRGEGSRRLSRVLARPADSAAPALQASDPKYASRDNRPKTRHRFVQCDSLSGERRCRR